MEDLYMSAKVFRECEDIDKRVTEMILSRRTPPKDDRIRQEVKAAIEAGRTDVLVVTKEITAKFEDERWLKEWGIIIPEDPYDGEPVD